MRGDGRDRAWREERSRRISGDTVSWPIVAPGEVSRPPATCADIRNRSSGAAGGGGTVPPHDRPVDRAPRHPARSGGARRRRARDLRPPGARVAARARPRLVGLLALVPPGRGRRPNVLRAAGLPHTSGAARHGDPDVARRRGAHGGSPRRALRALAPRLGMGGGLDLSLRRARDGRRPPRRRAVRWAASTRCRATPVFALVLAWWAGAVVRAWLIGSTTWLSAVGVGVALLTLTRPAAQIALLACVLVPLLARRRWTPALRGVATCLAAAVLPLAAWAAHNAVRYDDLAVARGSEAWSRSSASPATSTRRTAMHLAGSRTPSSRKS